MCALRGFPFVPLPCPPLRCPHGSLYLSDPQLTYSRLAETVSSHIISFLSMSVLAPAPSPAPSPAAVLAQIVLVFCLRGSMQIFVEWWSGKTITLEVEACYTIDTVEAKTLAQEGTPLDEQRLIWFGETLEGGALWPSTTSRTSRRCTWPRTHQGVATRG